MPIIRLAHWHGDHGPGDEIEVTDDELVRLRRDGRVAEVLDPALAPAAHDAGGWLPPGPGLALNDTGEPEQVLAPPDPEPKKRPGKTDT